jgi:hypothetical protein
LVLFNGREGIGPDGWKKGVSRLPEESVPHLHALS